MTVSLSDCLLSVGRLWLLNPVLFLFECVVTFPQEVEVFWNRKWTGPTWLYFLTRYTAVALSIVCLLPTPTYKVRRFPQLSRRAVLTILIRFIEVCDCRLRCSYRETHLLMHWLRHATVARINWRLSSYSSSSNFCSLPVYSTFPSSPHSIALTNLSLSSSVLCPAGLHVIQSLHVVFWPHLSYQSDAISGERCESRHYSTTAATVCLLRCSMLSPEARELGHWNIYSLLQYASAPQQSLTVIACGSYLFIRHFTPLFVDATTLFPPDVRARANSQ